MLALYLDKKQENNSLEDFLNNIVFGDTESVTVEPNQNMAIGYEKFIEGYKSGLTIEQEAVNYLRNKA